MVDNYGREINYMRVSVTDRCNLRCTYCMPKGITKIAHEEILSYEEILRICKEAVQLGILNFKITGGEPLVRKGCTDFVRRLKAIPGVETVTITTNGILLDRYLDKLIAAGIDGINISLDTTDKEVYNRLTGGDNCVGDVLQQVERCANSGIKTKINAVLLEETAPFLQQTASLAEKMAVDVRFIELMPIGQGATMHGLRAPDVLNKLREVWPDLHATNEKRGNGPARYYKSKGLQGRIGFISAISAEFCDGCNRVRLTSTGQLKPCLCFDDGIDLKPVLQQTENTSLQTAMAQCIFHKPKSHCFYNTEKITEQKDMHRIGG